MAHVANGVTAPSAKNLTVPVAKGPASIKSLTSAVHSVWTFVGTTPREAVDGLQLTVVVVGGSCWLQLGAPPVQAPAWQLSPLVQASLSSHREPLGAFTVVHAPLVGTQTPTTWHWSRAAQITGLAPTQTPATHVSLWVQALPSSQETVLGVWTQPDAELQESVVQTLLSSPLGADQ